MLLTAAILTISDKGAQGLRQDTSGPAVRELLEAAGWQVIYTRLIPDEYRLIRQELLTCCDDLRVCLAVTTGGTGLSPRDITPEATKSVLEREVPGIPEAMRAESLRVTPMGMLSREAAGIRGETLLINLPGSEKAVRECLPVVMPALAHGIAVLRGRAGACGVSAEKTR